MSIIAIREDVLKENFEEQMGRPPTEKEMELMRKALRNWGYKIHRDPLDIVKEIVNNA